MIKYPLTDNKTNKNTTSVVMQDKIGKDLTFVISNVNERERDRNETRPSNVIETSTIQDETGTRLRLWGE